MSALPRTLLCRLIARPQCAGELSLSEWETVIPAARATRLIARVAVRLQETEMLGAVPEGPRRHLDAALLAAARHRQDVLREVDRVLDVLAPTGVTPMLLKGAGYAAGGLAAADGRLFGDIDLMVPRDSLPEVEQALRRGGWSTGRLDPYDFLYYHRWMHQLPPLVHVSRESVLDVHHTLTAPVSRMAVDERMVLAAGRRVLDGRALVPMPADMVLHSAAHLFTDTEFPNGLRDLSDMDRLMRSLGTQPSWWELLVLRGRNLGLSEPLVMAFHHCRRLFETPVPDYVMARVRKDADHRRTTLTDRLFDHALHPDLAGCRTPLSGTASALLLLRGHMLRMPPRLLLPHLAHKTARAVGGWLKPEPPKRTA